MKKIFLSLFALIAMVVTTYAQRAWAYDLNLSSTGESYTFEFKATTAATATLLLSDEEGNNVGTLDLGAVVAGSNTFTYTTDQLPKAGKMNWAVKLTGGAVVEEVALKELNSTLFYNMMGIVADVNPESDHFGKVYMQMSYDGKPTYGTTKQTQGFFIFDPIFNLISTPNIGIKPTLPSGYTLDGTNRLQFHRVAIDPKTGNLAFCYSIANKPGVFSIGRNNLTGEVTNLLAGVTGVENIKRTNALCFDKDGALYIIADVTTASTTGNIYKILDGVATKLTLKGKKIWIDEQVGLVSDGRGGLWVAQNRSGITANSAVFHVNIAKDTIDFVLETDKDYSDWFAGGNGNNCRGGIAYNVKENILATHSQDAKVSLFKVTYDEETGIPTITKWLQGATGGKNTDAIAFDYAGDLYTGNSSGEYFKKFAVPTSDNTCTTPAPKAQVVINTDQTVYAVTTVVNEEAMGTVTGAGNYLAGESATLMATANTGYRFVNWTVGEETKTENPLTLTVNSDLAVIANFEAIPTYTITASVNDENMGAVEGAGTYYEGEKVSLTATPKQGYAFVAWSNDATDNPLVFTATEDVELTANFEILSYTLTVAANDAAKGSVDVTTGTYEYGTEVTITATPTEGHEFAGWSNGSKANPLTITVKEDTELTANFRQVLATSITLNALPVQDYSATIVGTLKRALQNGENTIVLTHEADGTPHIYNVAHATKTVTEISQEGVVAVDPDNKGDYLSISDIALTEDGKLVATNKIVCQSEDGQVAAGYKRGELRAYIWNDLAGAPSLWFTSKQSSNWYRSIQGHTIAYKGTSTNGTLFATGVTATGVKFRYSVYNVIDGVHTDPSSNNSDYYHFTKGSAQTTDALGANYQLVASPLASPNWILDGELVEPFEIVDPLTYNTEVTANPTLSVNLGQKYNGASCLANYNEHHLMVAPYANGEGYLAGVKVVDIVDGFAAATELTTNTDLATAENATAAAATAVVDAEGKLTIHLFSDAKVYTFTQKEQGPATAVDNTTVAPQVQKIIRDGQVLIIRDGKTFNMMGQEVK